MQIIFANYAPPPPFSPQTVSQELLASPLVPPQLSVKDFYMTGEAAVRSTNFLNPLSKPAKSLNQGRQTQPHSGPKM